MNAKEQKVLGLPDLTLFTVSAIVLLDTLAGTASIGMSSISWWIILGLIFMLPIGLITAELGTTYPEEGGVFHWIEKAFGPFWAGLAIWAYWVNTALWLPAIFVLFSGVSAQLFGFELTVFSQIFIGLALTWLVVSLEIIGLKIGKWVPNLGALFKLVIFAVLGIGGILYGMKNGMANTASIENLKPNIGAGFQYLPLIIYGMLGFELVSSAGDNIDNPHRNVPRGILMSGILIICLYIIATLGILIALPTDQIDIVEGLIDTLNLFFSNMSAGSSIVLLLGILALFTFFSNAVTWSIGCNRAMAEAAENGLFPKVFAFRHKHHGGAIGASVLMGVVCSSALILYGGMVSSNEDLFWALFSFSAMIFMLPYLGMCLAFVRLRQKDKNAIRPFKVPGGQNVAVLLGALCSLVLVLTILLFAYVPGTGEDSGFQAMTVAGFAVVMMIGLVIVMVCNNSRRR